MGRGKSNMKIKNYSAAIEAFKEAVAINPDNREACKLLGEAYENQGLTDNAIQQYESYVKKFNDDADIAFKLGDFLQWERYKYRKDDAVKYYKTGLSQKNDKNYRYKLARLLSARKETSSEAITEYKKLINEDPSNKRYKEEYRALLVWDESHIHDAIPEYKKLADENPDNFELNHEYAKLLARDKNSNTEAINRYENLIEKQKSNVKLREEYADVLSANKARFDDAKREYEFVIANGGGNRAREKYADLLSSRQSQHAEAKKQYEIIIKNNPSDSKTRLKYAKLLGSKKQTLPQAINQYETVLKYESRNAESHAGLARAYAWMGNKEKAVYHSNLAAKYAPKNKDALDLKKELTRGREPFLGVKMNYLYQPGDWNGINGFFLGAQGRFDPVTQFTLQGIIGYETYKAGDEYQKNANGAVVKADAIYRHESINSAEFMLGYHALMRCGDGIELLIQYMLAIPDFEIKAGFSRELIYESITSLAGFDTWKDGKKGTYIGAGKNNRFYANVYKKLSFLEASVDPYFGWVSSQSASSNDQAGLSARVCANISLQQNHRGVIAYQISTKHFRYNCESFSKTDTTDPGGYFSPQSYMSHEPRIEYHYEDFSLVQIHAAIGPSFYRYKKNVKTLSSNRTVITREKEDDGVGIYFSGEYQRFVKDNIAITFKSAFDKAGPAYSKFVLDLSLRYLF